MNPRNTGKTRNQEAETLVYMREYNSAIVVRGNTATLDEFQARLKWSSRKKYPIAKEVVVHLSDMGHIALTSNTDNTKTYKLVRT